MSFRVGHGYDVHRLEAGRRLVLGGVEIPHEKGLLGHSDADVLVHAIMDALLGAGGLGDIGMSFPDTHPTYEDISSLRLLWQVGQMLVKAGWWVENVDATVIAQKPRLTAVREEMRGNVATAIGIPLSCVNIKFTTEEGLGFTGKNKGIAAQAVCLISRKSFLPDGKKT
ncbi:MAG: 2-C-methyl-D-erythritol 2,4-cyclodiphosphate synthase [Defluviitaleaceae bacterium]|nr:2-C-methyl-D-erythritol 2,4-cyclodiphosphate synthase [Defluviitaleaceae bacterium]